MRFGVAWNYTPFHHGSIAAIKYSRDRNEAAVNVQKWIGYLWGRVLFLNDNNNGLDGNNNLNNNRSVGIVRLTMLGLLILPNFDDIYGANVIVIEIALWLLSQHFC